MGISNNLKLEAKAFDDQIQDRVLHGHIPDLENTESCDYFYNNCWRRPEYARMILGEYVDFFQKELAGKSKKIIEIACGPGYLTLQLARNGLDVTGVDISEESIKIAYETARRFDNGSNFGNLRYLVNDFFSLDESDKYDGICFNQALHHFDNLDEVIDKITKILNPGGQLVVVEPARDFFDVKDSTIVGLIRVLLSLQGAWHQTLEEPKSQIEIRELSREIFTEYVDARTKAEALQSPHDNESNARQMLEAIGKRFDQIKYKDGFSFIHRIIGGIRGENEKVVMRTARFLWNFDVYCVENEILKPGVFYYSGILK